MRCTRHSRMKTTAHQPAPDPAIAPVPIASWLHLVGLLVLLLALTAAGVFAQQAATASAGAVQTKQLADHGDAVGVYVGALIVDWSLFVYCYVGVRRTGGRLAAMSGERWHSAREVLGDIALAVPFWALWEGVAYGAHHLLDWFHQAGEAAKLDSLLPKSSTEILLWMSLCLSAGFCEEIVFRGYLQKQFHALTKSIAAAIVLQGFVFGISHGYQGWKNVVVISVLGFLYGALAAWRRNLHVNILSHAWSDAWEGWLEFILFR
jgi:membrane protease YdiL (CAAX protease family)